MRWQRVRGFTTSIEQPRRLSINASYLGAPVAATTLQQLRAVADGRCSSPNTELHPHADLPHACASYLELRADAAAIERKARRDLQQKRGRLMNAAPDQSRNNNCVVETIGGTISRTTDGLNSSGFSNIRTAIAIG
jgi:hypothetical protein